VCRNSERRPHETSPEASLESNRTLKQPTFEFESLEERRLLASTAAFPFADVRFGGVVYEIAVVSGPGGVQTHRTRNGTVGINLLGTTQDSQVSITALISNRGQAIKRLAIGSINVRSGHVGSIQGLTSANLTGRVSPLQGIVNSLQFNSVGPAAQITVIGNLGQLTVNQGISLGKTGRIYVSNDLAGSLSVTRDVDLNGGHIIVGRDLSGSVALGGNVALTDDGQFIVGRNLGATASTASAGTITGNLTVDSGSAFSIGGNVSALIVNGNIEASGNGVISVGGNVTTLMANGGGGSSVTGNVNLSSGGELVVGQNLTTLSVGSDLQTSGGGEVKVGGNLGALSVTGVMAGKGSDDVVVGDDLGQLVVLGGGNNVFSLTDVDIDASGSIQGLDIRNGITNSLITAGIVINGGTPGAGSNGWNIGSNGSAAVFDSQILAGTEIENLVIGGNVVSDKPSNPAGLPTRIVAGESPENAYTAGGTIDKFQIVGNLINSVIAASVEPSNGTYPEPAAGPNSTAPPFANPSVPMTLVLAGGAINPSFATSSGTPSTLTVTGAVTSSTHVYTADNAGIFASNTTGVKVGTPSA
jgi:hypothetical protein